MCFGRIGRLSRRRRPGANGSGNLTTTVRASGAVTSSGLPWTLSAEASRLPTPGSYAARNENSTSADVIGWPSENFRSGPDRDRVDLVVGRHGPALGQPRLELVGRAIDPDQPGLGEERHDVGRRRCPGGDVAVVGRRLGSNRREELAATRRHRTGARSGRRFGRSTTPIDRKTYEKPCHSEGQTRSGHNRPRPANKLAGLPIHVNRPFFAGIRYPEAVVGLARQHVGCIGRRTRVREPHSHHARSFRRPLLHLKVISCHAKLRFLQLTFYR